MKCCDIKAGDLRSLIIIERKTSTPDAMGGNTVAWAEDPAGGVKAKWEAKSGRQFYVGQREGGEVSAVATIRWRGDAYGAPYYTQSDRVKFRNRQYDVVSARDPDDRQRWLVLDLKESRAS